MVLYQRLPIRPNYFLLPSSCRLSFSPKEDENSEKDRGEKKRDGVKEEEYICGGKYICRTSCRNKELHVSTCTCKDVYCTNKTFAMTGEKETDVY